MFYFAYGAEMTTVKGIQIDSKNKVLKYENIDKADLHRRYLNEVILRKANSTSNQTVALYYDDSTIMDLKDYPRHGFFLWPEALQSRYNNKNYSDLKSIVQPIIGHAIIVNYEESISDKKPKRRYTAVDTTVTLEEAARLVVEYTSGIETFLPEFTCMIAENTEQSGLEIMLRLENEGGPQTDLDRPIKNLSPQLVNFSLGGREITIMTGRISDLNEKVHIGIYESNRADMRCVGACTLAADKIPGWVKNRLEDFFFNVITKPLSDELNFQASMHEMHTRLEID